MFNRAFWKGAFERAVKTAAQFALVAFGADTASIISVEWQGVAAAAAAGFVVSVLTSLGSEPFGPLNSPSVVFTDDL